jgi:hypothetical protein
MAGGPFYLFNTSAPGGTAGLLQDGGAAPAALTTGTGWTVGTTVAGPDYSDIVFATKRLASTFSATAAPTGPPLGTNALRTQNPLTGTFPSGNWSLAFAFVSVSNAMSGTGHLRVSVWASSNPTGTGARQIAAALDFSNFAASSVGTPQNTTLTWAAPAIALNSEYLFFRAAWEITVASGNANADALFRQDGAHSVITPTRFTPTATAAYPRIPSPFGGPGRSVGPFRHWQSPPTPLSGSFAIASGSVPTITLTAPTGTALIGTTVSALGTSFAPNPIRGPNVAGPDRYFLTRAPPPVGQQVIAQGSPGTIVVTPPVAQAIALLGLTSALAPSPFGGSGRAAGPIRHWAAPPVQLGGNAARVSGSLPSITLTAPLGGAVATSGTATPYPWRGPITRGPQRTFVPQQAPQGQQIVVAGDLAGDPITLTPPMGVAVASIGLTSALGPAPFPAPGARGPWRSFFEPPTPPLGVGAIGTGAIGTVTLTVPSGGAVAGVSAPTVFPWRGPNTQGPKRTFPKPKAEGITIIATGVIPTITLAAPLGSSLSYLGKADPFPYRSPTSLGPRRELVPYGQAYSSAAIAIGTIGTVTLTAVSGAGAAFAGVADRLPWRGPRTQGPARAFHGLPAYALVGSGPITASGSLPTITLTAGIGGSVATSGTATTLPWRGPTTQGPARRFAAPPTFAHSVTPSGAIGTISLAAPAGAAYATSGTAASLPWRGPTTRGPMRRFVAPKPYGLAGVSAAGTIGTITVTPPSAHAVAAHVVVVGLSDSFLGLYQEPWLNKFD